jgi:hypothetical protein
MSESAFTIYASQIFFNQKQKEIKKNYSDYEWYNLMQEYLNGNGYALVELESEETE